MRAYTFVLFGAALVAATSDAVDAMFAVLSGQPVWDNMCGYDLYNQSQFLENGAGIRFQQMFADYNSIKDDLRDPHFITGYFMPKYLPGSSIVGGSCNVLQQCNLVPTCLAINQSESQQEKNHIYAIANSISNLNNALNFHHEAFQDAAIQLAGLWPSMETTFTWKDEVREYEQERRRVRNDFITFWWKVINNIYSDVGAVNGAITQASSGIMSPAAATSYGTFAAAVTMGIRFSQQAFDFAEFFQRKHLLNQPLPAVPKEGWVGQQLTNGILAQNTELQDTMARILAGETFGPFNLISLLNSGLYARPLPAQSVKLMTDSILERMIGAAIDAIWQGEQVYITEADGDCVGNQANGRDKYRGPTQNEVCLPEEPNKIFHIYSLPRYQEETNKCITSPATPPGWSTILASGPNGYYGITPEKIIRSAISRNRLRGNIPIELDHDGGFSFALKNPATALTAAQSGLFNIGVCYTPNGKFVSSLNTKDGRQYPCECKNTNATMTDPEAFANFLDLTGFAVSKDFFQGCKESKRDRQGCKLNTKSDMLAQFYHRQNPVQLATMKKKITTFMFTDCKEQRGNRSQIGVPQSERSPHGSASC